MYHDNKYETIWKTAKNIYARSFMIEIPEIHRTIEHRVMKFEKNKSKVKKKDDSII